MKKKRYALKPWVTYTLFYLEILICSLLLIYSNR